jgi:hypothetical protein
VQQSHGQRLRAPRSRVTTGEAGREESGQMSEPDDWEKTGAELPSEAMSPRQSRLIVEYYSR